MGLYRGCSTFFASQVMLAFIQFTTFDGINGVLTQASETSKKHQFKGIAADWINKHKNQTESGKTEFTESQISLVLT